MLHFDAPFSDLLGFRRVARRADEGLTLYALTFITSDEIWIVVRDSGLERITISEVGRLRGEIQRNKTDAAAFAWLFRAWPAI